jgi:SAM-dependent methyltransferase
MEPQTLYAKSGGLRIAYQVIGAGPDLVMVPGLTPHLEIQWRDPGYRRFVRSLSPFSRLVRFAADLDTRLLQDIAAPNIEVRQLDLVSDQLPRGEFDFIHTRMVLMHIPAREQVLGRLRAALRPGGTVMIEEQDGFPVLANAAGAYREAWLAFIRVCRAAGVDPDWTRDLPLRRHRHALVDVSAEVDVPLFRGGSDHARFWSLTWQQVQSSLAAIGEPAHVIDRGRAELDDEQRWFHGPAMVTAWGRLSG